MVLLQKFSPPTGSTFKILAEKIFEVVLSTNSRIIDVVFDCYWDISIKNAERTKRNISVEGVKYPNILPTYPVKAWSRFLSVLENKTEIVKFIVSEWKKLSVMDKLFNKILYVTENKLCWKLDMFGN